MCPTSMLCVAAVLLVALVWPLALHGYRFYVELVAAETAKHEEAAQRQGSGAQH